MGELINSFLHAAAGIAGLILGGAGALWIVAAGMDAFERIKDRLL